MALFFAGDDSVELKKNSADKSSGFSALFSKNPYRENKGFVRPKLKGFYLHPKADLIGGNMTKTVAIYARVSTHKQNVDMQSNELRAFADRVGWQIVGEYIDENFTGSNTKRPAFIEMMNAAKKRKFNILLVWRLDRLSRSLKDLINTIDELGAMGIDFVAMNNNIDTTTPAGKFLFQIIGAVAEFEKDIIRERVISGIANARAKGKRFGRPSLPPEIMEKGRELKEAGHSFRSIERQLDLGDGTIRKNFPQGQGG